MDLDSQARQQALDLRQSFCVRAPAGSGKTGLLVSRALAALAQVDEPEQVLAITFTRKAAFEIRERLREALDSADAPPPADNFAQHIHALATRVRQRDRERGWELQHNPNRLRATTIDGLNRDLARHMPLMTGLGAPLQPLDDATELYRQALVRALDRHEDTQLDGALRQSLDQVLQLGQNRLDPLLQKLHQLLAERGQWAGIDPSDDAWERGQYWLEQWTRSSMCDILAQLPLATADAWALTLAELAQALPDSPWQPVQAATAWPAAQPEHIEQWQCLARSLLTQTGTLRKPGGLNVRSGFPKGPTTTRAKELMQEWQDHLSPSCVHALRALLDLPSRYSQEEAERSQHLLVVLRFALAELKLIFAESGRCDHTEIALAAATALANESSGVGQRMDARIQHLLVDEMQDTSQSQLQLLAMLVRDWQPGDGRSLFLVGDPQQSIYAFRQARVEGFQRLLQPGASLGPVPLQALQLARNFRSNPTLVEWTNAVMARIFEAHGSPIRFAPSTAARTQAAADHAIVWHSCQSEAEEVQLALTQIRQLQAQQPNTRIGVLARTRAHLLPLAQALRQANMTFSGIDLQPLSEQSHVRDFLAGLRLLHHPADGLSWIRWLRSPALGLNWAQIDQLRATDLQSSWARLVLAASPPEDYPEARWQHAIDTLSNVLQRRQSGLALAEAARLLYAGLGQHHALDGPARTDISRVLAFLREHCMGGQLRDEAAFLRGLQRLWAAAATAPLELMTVHKSKGLEFDQVFLMGLGRGGRGGEEPLLGWHPDHPEAVLSIQPSAMDSDSEASIYPWLRRTTRHQEAAEQLRLLYVALTRARDGLHLFALPKAASGSLGAALASVGQWPEVDEDRAEEASAGGLEWVRQRRFSTVPKAPEQPQFEMAPRRGPSPSQLGAAQDPAPTLSAERLKATVLGTAVHQTLEYLAIHGLEQWQQRREQMLQSLRAALTRQGLPQADAASTLTQVEAMIDRATQGQARWLLQDHPWQRNEYALAGRLEGRLVQGVIDRCFITQDGELWLVDYKTNHPPAELEQAAWIASMEQQYRVQMDRYAQLLLGTQPATQHCICALYLVATDSLHSWRFPA